MHNSAFIVYNRAIFALFTAENNCFLTRSWQKGSWLQGVGKQTDMQRFFLKGFANKFPDSMLKPLP
jgi:hypothetical protein